MTMGSALCFFLADCPPFDLVLNGLSATQKESAASGSPVTRGATFSEATYGHVDTRFVVHSQE
jgi:hypothetical protein